MPAPAAAGAAAVLRAERAACAARGSGGGSGGGFGGRPAAPPLTRGAAAVSAVRATAAGPVETAAAGRGGLAPLPPRRGQEAGAGAGAGAHPQLPPLSASAPSSSSDGTPPTLPSRPYAHAYPAMAGVQPVPAPCDFSALAVGDAWVVGVAPGGGGGGGRGAQGPSLRTFGDRDRRRPGA